LESKHGEKLIILTQEVASTPEGISIGSKRGSNDEVLHLKTESQVSESVEDENLVTHVFRNEIVV
jgi:hypothetical protein